MARGGVVAELPKKPGAVVAEKKITRRGRSSSDLDVLIPIMRGLKEPFCADDIARAGKVDWKKASNTITRFKLKGWITSSGTRGEYQRTKSFGGNSQPAQIANYLHRKGESMLADIHKEIAEAKKTDE